MKPVFYNYLQELYYFLSAALICFVILEMIQPGLVLGYLNLNYWLIFWLADGILLVYLKK